MFEVVCIKGLIGLIRLEVWRPVRLYGRIRFVEEMILLRALGAADLIDLNLVFGLKERLRVSVNVPLTAVGILPSRPQESNPVLSFVRFFPAWLRRQSLDRKSVV